MSSEIPVWVNGQQRWISGIGRKTTCDDVICVLLRAEGVNVVEEQRHTKHYAIVERWRKVERPLDGRSRILKVWSTWGDEQQAVRLTLRRVSPTTPRDVKTLHQRRSSKPAPPPHYRATRLLLQTIHPRRLLQHHADNNGGQTSAGSFTDGMERLMKLILAQGETIQSQLRRLHERDEQITRIEHKVHRSRVEKLGSNYLLETYLGSTETGEPVEDEEEEEEEEREDDSGVAEVGSGNGSEQPAEPGTSSPVTNKADAPRKQRCRQRSKKNVIEDVREDEDGAYCAAGESSSSGEEGESQSALVELRARISLWERIVRVNKRLEQQEQCLVKLHVKLRRYSEEEEAEPVAEAATEEATALLREQLEEALALSTAQGRELEAAGRALEETGSDLDARHRLLDCLQDELRATEAEGDHLRVCLEARSRPPAAPYIHHSNKPHQHFESCTKSLSSHHHNNKHLDPGDTDSNSDTGLSSLHSSSEEGVYVLDTLV